MKKLVVIVPIYKECLSEDEKKSIEICQAKLQSYDLCFIAPQSLDIRNYQRYSEFEMYRFSDKFFRGTDTYNKLLLDIKFYSRFLEYEYMLIAQTDTFILKGETEIDYFLKLKYDYIGAPWKEEGYIFYTTKRVLYEKFGWGEKMILRMGNGGLSLRNVNKSIELLREKYLWKTLWNGNEDFFFSCYGGDNKCGFELAPIEIAQHFAVETNMRETLEGGHIPFGVHKWSDSFTDYREVLKYIEC